MTTALALLRQQYLYHTWRVHRWVDHLLPLSEAHFQQPIPGSFSHFHLLLVHIAGGERLLFNLTTGPDALSKPDKPESEADGHAWLHHWADIADLWLPVFDLQPDAWWDDTVHFRTRGGAELPLRRWDAALQVLDHCTYHSGQITTALRALDVPPAKSIGYLQWKLSHPEG